MKEMKKPIRILPFLFGQAAVVALAIFLGWHLGPRANRQETLCVHTENARLREDLSRSKCLFVRQVFQIVRRMEKSGQDSSHVHALNRLIDRNILEQIAWVLVPGGDSLHFGPATEDWYWVTASIGEYREIHPVKYDSQEMKDAMHRLFQQAKDKRAELMNKRSSNQ